MFGQCGEPVVENQFFGKRYGMYQVDGIETLSDFRLFENGKEGGDAGAGAEHHQILAVGEAFRQEEAGGIFIEQDGVALLHFGETGRHGAVLDEYGKIFERVCIFCGNDGVGTPNKAFPFVETESGELSRFKTVGFGTADGESDQFRRVVFDPQNLFFSEFCFGRGCHVVVLECVCRDYSQFGCFFFCLTLLDFMKKLDLTVFIIILFGTLPKIDYRLGSNDDG